MSARLAAGLAALALAAATPALAAHDGLEGVWRYRASSQPVVHGPLKLQRRGRMWRAMIGRRSASTRLQGDRLRFVFSDGQGELRARVRGSQIEAYWLQPAQGVAGASGAAQPFASPVRLQPAGAQVWSGQVRPLPYSFTLWLKVFRSEDGALTAAFRNPEANSIGGRTQFLVTREGGDLRFATRPQAGRAPIDLTARLTNGRIMIDWPDAGGTIALAPVRTGEAADFYPRPPHASPYVYAAPPRLADGWPTARASTVGLEEAALQRIVRAQAASDPAGMRPQLMHSILVARHGKLVLEEYFFGFHRATPHDLRSAAKSFTSVMLGAAMRGDPGLGPESRAFELLAARGPFGHPDPRKAQITLAQLLTHSAGLACDDNDDASPGNEATMQRQSAEPDWAKYALDLPMAYDPGTHYAYCSANLNLVAAALSARTATWLPALFAHTIAKPLQFGPWYWNLTPTGEGYGGGGVQLTPRDFLKIGQAYLDGGQWRGRRIVEASWVKTSTGPHIDVTPQTTGLSAQDFQNAYVQAQDGYAWHLNQLKAGQRTFQDFEASGNGGQLLIVVPDADLVVAITGGNYGQGGIWTRWRDDIVGQQILTHIR